MKELPIVRLWHICTACRGRVYITFTCHHNSSRWTRWNLYRPYKCFENTNPIFLHKRLVYRYRSYGRADNHSDRGFWFESVTKKQCTKTVRARIHVASNDGTNHKRISICNSDFTSYQKVAHHASIETLAYFSISSSFILLQVAARGRFGWKSPLSRGSEGSISRFMLFRWSSVVSYFLYSTPLNACSSGLNAYSSVANIRAQAVNRVLS